MFARIVMAHDDSIETGFSVIDFVIMMFIFLLRVRISFPSFNKNTPFGSWVLPNQRIPVDQKDIDLFPGLETSFPLNLRHFAGSMLHGKSRYHPMCIMISSWLK